MSWNITQETGAGGPDSAGVCGVMSCGHLRGMGWHRGHEGVHVPYVPSPVRGAKGIFLDPAFSPCPICSAWLPEGTEVGRKGVRGWLLMLQTCLRVGDGKEHKV